MAVLLDPDGWHSHLLCLVRTNLTPHLFQLKQIVFVSCIVPLHFLSRNFSFLAFFDLDGRCWRGREELHCTRNNSLLSWPCTSCVMAHLVCNFFSLLSIFHHGPLSLSRTHMNLTIFREGRWIRQSYSLLSFFPKYFVLSHG